MGGIRATLPGGSILAFCLSLAAVPAAAQDGLPAPLFRSHEPLQLRLEGDFGRLWADRGEEAGEHEARLSYVDDAGERVELPLQLSTRGNFRNRENVCRYPPLELDLPRDALAGTLFEGENRLKLVSHCQRRLRYSQYLLLEYLNYRMLNLLTDYSLRVRLLDIDYADAGSGETVIRAQGFLVEDLGRMAARKGLSEAELRRVRRDWYDPGLFTLVAVFQYLIGNTDWSALVGPEGEECCHNLYPLQYPSGIFVPVPYDFDVSGTVNPRYASPPRQLGIRRFTQRLYRGGCPEPAALEEALALLRDKRGEILGLVENQAGLQPMTRRQTLAFLDEFFAEIGEGGALPASFMHECAEPPAP